MTEPTFKVTVQILLGDAVIGSASKICNNVEEIVPRPWQDPLNYVTVSLARKAITNSRKKLEEL